MNNRNIPVSMLVKKASSRTITTCEESVEEFISLKRRFQMPLDSEFEMVT